MLWSVDVCGFFKEYLNNGEAIREWPFSPPYMSWSDRGWDLFRKCLNKGEVIREGGPILRYHFRVRREVCRARKHPSLSAIIVVIRAGASGIPK